MKKETKLIIIEKHKVSSREVDLEKDLDRIMEDGAIMFDLVTKPIGIWSSSYALAHSQVTKKDPLRFFVTKDGDAVINPVITRHSGYTVPHQEGCLTFHGKNDGTVKVPRWRKIDAEWFELHEDTGKPFRVRMSLEGKPAMVFQHEIQHMDGIYIYDKRMDIPPRIRRSPIVPKKEVNVPKKV